MISPQMNQDASCPTKITAWQTTGNTAGDARKTWADGDGDVDTSDLTTSIINFTSALSSGASAVPEPGSLILLLLGITFLASRRRWLMA